MTQTRRQFLAVLSALPAVVLSAPAPAVFTQSGNAHLCQVHRVFPGELIELESWDEWAAVLLADREAVS